MAFFNKLFGKDEPVVDHKSFWDWFAKNERMFHQIVKNSDSDNVDTNFLEEVMPKLSQLNPQFYCLVGMLDDNTAELVITAEGEIKTIVFAEDLVAAAPRIAGWKFTALKPAIGFDGIKIKMDDHTFDDENVSFFTTKHDAYPDEIDITLVHKDFNGDNEPIIKNGCLIYLDNALGELNAATLIDTVDVKGPSKDNGELIPLNKLIDFLQWREKEFVEKYKGVRHNTEKDSYSSMEGQDSNGMPVIAILNQELMDWDAKASHPWMMIVEIKYDGENGNGMPDDETYQLMEEFEEALMKKLVDSDGYLNIGRETYNSTRTIFFACKDFRNASRITSGIVDSYLEQLEISYEIVRDKYWKTMNRFL